MCTCTPIYSPKREHDDDQPRIFQGIIINSPCFPHYPSTKKNHITNPYPFSMKSGISNISTSTANLQRSKVSVASRWICQSSPFESLCTVLMTFASARIFCEQIKHESKNWMNIQMNQTSIEKPQLHHYHKSNNPSAPMKISITLPIWTGASRTFKTPALKHSTLG